MERMKVPEFLFKEMASRFGSGEEGKLTVITNVATGESHVEVEHTIVERYPVQEIETAIRLYEKLGMGGGRYMMKLEEVATFRPKKK